MAQPFAVAMFATMKTTSPTHAPLIVLFLMSVAGMSACPEDAASVGLEPDADAVAADVGRADGEADTTSVPDGSSQHDVAPDVADAEADVAPDTAPDATADLAPTPLVWLDVYPIQAQFPEGGIYDTEDHAFYVGSLGDGSVHRIDAATGDETVMFTPDEPGVWWTLGMDVDVERRLLWVCAMDDQRDMTDDDPPYDGYVWVFDLLTGERVANHDLSDAFATATCTDVAVTEDGTAYVVDREHPNIYRINDAGVSLFTSDDKLDGLVVGQNAVSVLPDESALLVIVYLDSELLRVDLTTGAVTEVDIDGSFFDAAFLGGADGMTLADGSAWVAFTSELVRVDPTTAGWGQAKATEVDVDSGMTDVVATPNGLYLLNGQAVKFALDQDTDPFQLVRFTGAL